MFHQHGKFFPHIVFEHQKDVLRHLTKYTEVKDGV